MPKSKRAPALFELIGSRGDKNTAEKLAVPKWLKTGPQPEQRTQPEPQTRPALDPAPAAARPTASMPPDAGDLGPPIARVRSGRLELSLNPTNAIIIGGGLVIALLCVYLVGHGVGAMSGAPVQVAGGPAQVDDVSLAMKQPANGDVLEPQHNAALIGARSGARTEAERGPTLEKAKTEKAAVPAAAAPTEAAAPASGPNRIVVERFKLADQKSAEHVQKWLAEDYDLKTELRPVKDNIWLVTVAGFNLEEPGQKQALEQLIKDLKTLGKDCGRELASRNLTPYLLKGPEAHRFEK